MALQTVRFEEFFAAPRETVFAWFAQHENVGRLFYCSSVKIREAQDGADVNGVGSTRRVRHGPLRLDQTITRFEPPRLIEYRGAARWPIGEQRGRLQFEAVPGGTQLAYDIEFDSRLPGSGGVLSSLLASTWRRGIQRAVEATSTPTTGR